MSEVRKCNIADECLKCNALGYECGHWQIAFEEKYTKLESENASLQQYKRELVEVLEAVVKISDRKHDAWDKAHELIAKHGEG